MNKLLLGLIFAVIFAQSFVFCFEMETTFVKHEKKIQWTVKSLSELNFMSHVINYDSNRLESLPFFPFENNPEEWVIGVITTRARQTDGPIMDFYIRSLDSRETSDQFIAGTITFKNSTNHTLYKKSFEKCALVREIGGNKPPVRRVSIVSMELQKIVGRDPVPDRNLLPAVFEKLNNVLILEFSLRIVTPFTVFTN